MLNLNHYIEQEIITKDFKSSIPEEYAGYYLERLLWASEQPDPMISDYFLLDSLDAVNELPEELENRHLDKLGRDLTMEDVCITKFTYKAFPIEDGKTIFEYANPYHNFDIILSCIKEREWPFIWDCTIIDEDYQIYRYDKEAKTLTIFLVHFL